MEFIFMKVSRNANAQQDAMKKLETRSEAMAETEKRLRREIAKIEENYEQMHSWFRFLREDRS